MKIESIILKNFRGYEKETKINLDDLSVFVGKNDAGKSTILEALDIFFNEGKGAGVVKLDKDDVNVNCRNKGDVETVITVVFTDLPDVIILDSTVETTLEKEYLLNSEGKLEISKKYKNGGAQKVWIKAYHPQNKSCSDLLNKKNADLRKIIKENEIECLNLTTNSIMRHSIWNHFEDNLNLDTTEIDASKADVKQIWEKLYSYMPVYTLFQSDRANTDNDSEVQDPLKEAVKLILKEPSIHNILDEVSDKVYAKLTEVSDRTLEKLREVNEEIADELTPVIPSADKLKWHDVFKTVSISGDNNIPINKRGSGTKRLILMSFFRGEVERLSNEGESTGIIYAVEEPETSQHTNNQKILIEAFKEMSKISGVQVLLTTHSAYMVKQLDYKNLKIINEDKTSVDKVLHVKKNYLHYPSLNEVNYLAFNEINEEYHNELYGSLQEIAMNEDSKSNTVKGFDNWLKSRGIKNNLTYVRVQKNNESTTYNVTLPTFIRNIVHHPENLNNRYTKEQLKESILMLREIYSEMKMIE